ncbi:MAG: phosphatidate cytidylyltransferase [Lachnospiraceae bacterium]|nr:phosphatidate cytidylyltransferase [Lachnospiraceae bacterium]
MTEFGEGTLQILLYFIICVIVVFSIRRLFKVPDELFRKLLHFVLLGSLWVWMHVFPLWWHALLTVLLFTIFVYPVLIAAEHIKGYSHFVTERKNGELKKSLLLVFGMFAILLTVAWGLFDDKNLALASIFAWGIGDAAAALIGKRFGKHFLEGKHIEGRKSVEGTLSMFAFSFLSVFFILLSRHDMPVYACLLIAVITAIVSAFVELFSTGGNDTVFCPLAAMAVLIPLLYLFGGISL